MNSFESEIMNNFGVKLRSRQRASEHQFPNPSMLGTRPHSMVSYPAIPLSRCVYLPGTQGEERRLDNFRPHIAGADNWQMGYRQCQLIPGNTQWQSKELQKSKLGNFFSKKKPNNQMKRSQSFNQVSFPPSSPLTQAHPLLAHRARSLSASQASLTSNFSKFSFKLGNILGSKRSTTKPSDVDREAFTKELPYVAFHRQPTDVAHQPQQAHHQDHHQEQHFSELCGIQKYKKHRRQADRDLPDLVPHMRPGPSPTVPRILNIGHYDPDIWFSKDILFKDHIAEVVSKWENVDDEIWGKLIIFERNRRVAKAYARSAVLTINGSDAGFNGLNIGVNGFENPRRDREVQDCKAAIGAGCKLKMTENGDILIKRIGKGKVFIQNILEEAAVSNDILKLYSGLLEPDIAMKLFDMKKFKQNMNRELKRQAADRAKLEKQCILCISFIQNQADLLDSPIWVMMINMVALEMLHAKIPNYAPDYSLDSAGFSSESSAGLMKGDVTRRRSKALLSPDYYSGYSAWTRGAPQQRDQRCGRRRLPVPRDEPPSWIHDYGNTGRINHYSDC